MTPIIRSALIALGSLLAIVVLVISMLAEGGAAEGAAVPGTSGAVETTAPASVEHELVVVSPQPGDVVGSPLLIAGHATAQRLGYRLFAAGSPLIEGTINADSDGGFSATVEFTNNCCIEMTLEVFDIEPDAGLGVSIPLAYPETS